MPPKIARCGPAEARRYLTKARGYLDAARLFADEHADVAASNAVHAAITAADAICCARARRRSRDPDHARAVEVLAFIDPEAARWLQQALAARHRAQYDDRPVSPSEAIRSIRAAEQLVERAARTVA